MNNTYRKFFKVLRAWWLTLMLFAFIPMTYAQTITNIAVAPAVQYPGEDVAVTVSVLGFTDAATYNYYVVYNYQDYDKLLQFTHDQTTDIDLTGLVAGDGDIVITATVPVELYTYGTGELTVLVVDNDGNLVYQLEAPDAWVSDYPVCAGGFYNMGNLNFDTYNYVDRSIETPMFYEFDANTDFSFTIRRINEEPAIKNEILVEFRVGATAWQPLDTIDLNDVGYLAGTPFSYDNTPPNWDTDIEDGEITVRISQTDGKTLPSGIDTWEITNFVLNDVLNEPDPGSIYTEVFNYFYVENLVTLWEPGADNFEIAAPSFSITAFNSAAVDLYPGVQVTYEITAGANVNFPAATIFEVYLTNGILNEEILLGTFPLTGATGLPAATNTKDFTFNLPFRPDANWELNVRADLRDTYVSSSWGTFEILGVNLSGTIDLDATPAAEKFELDGVTYLYPGSELNVTYELAAGQTINTANLDVDIVLEYNEGGDWIELKRQAFSNTDPRTITVDLPGEGLITANSINIRLYLAYGDVVNYQTTYIERVEDLGFGGNVDMLPYEGPMAGTWIAGTKIGFHAFAANNTAQTLVADYYYDGQPTYVQLGSVNTLATDSKYVLNYANSTANFSIVPTGELSIDNPYVRLRWADGVPLGTNKVIVRGFRMQVPYDSDLGVYAYPGSVGILYPHLTLSTNVAQLYEYADTLSSVDIKVVYSKLFFPSTTQIAVVLVENGNDPEVDPYIYLGSKAAGATDGKDSITFNVPYTKIQEFIGGHLPNLPDAGDFFDVYLYATDKDATDPIMFKTEDFDVTWKENYDAQPMMITDFIDLTGLNAPIYLSYDWVEGVTPDPLNSLTTPIMEFSIDSGSTWTAFDTYPFTEEIELTGAVLTAKTQFRWRQVVELGDWDVQNVVIKTGEDNLVEFVYGTTNIPQTIELVLAEVEVPPVDDPCEDFNNASPDAYDFVTEVESVNAGETFDFEWNYLLGAAKSKAIVDSSLLALGQYIHGENSMDFNLMFDASKKITQFTMTFPANVVPTKADTIIVDGNSLVPVITAATRLITWTNDDGVVIGANDIDFNVTFTVATSIVDPIDVAWTLKDADATVSGTCTILPAAQYPEGTVFTFYINDGEMQQIAQGTETGPYTAVIPEGTPTGAYDIYLGAKFSYYDEGLGADVMCGGIPPVFPSNSPAQFDYGSNTYSELGWTEFDVTGSGTIQSVTIDFTWNTDTWVSEGRFYLQSPTGTVATLIGGGLADGTYSMSPSVFAGEEVNGTWYLWIQDSWGDGGHQATDITISFDVAAPYYLVYEDLFVVNDQTPEVYEIELTNVDFIDPADDYYWGQNVDVKFNTFGPWQNFEDLRYEAVLTQYGISDPVVTFSEDFEGGIPAEWNNVGPGYLWDWTDGVAIHWDDSGVQDDWLITPQISLPAGTNSLEFWDYGYYPSYYDQNSILVSTGSPDPGDGDFVTIWAPASIVSGWTYQEVDLSAYSGQDVYIAFRYQGNWSHYWGVDDVVIMSGVWGNTDFYNLGNVPHVEGENMFAETFALPAFEDLEGKNFDLDIEGTDFVVEIRAFQGVEGDSFIPGIVIENIDEFFLLNGTEQETTPLTFDIEDVLRYAITNKLPLDGYAGQDVYLQFTYNADITAPNYLTLPRLQVTMDNGVTYTDIAIDGSTFEEQERLDASAVNMVYRYQIADEYLTNDTRFRWYQEVPDGVWSIDDISITRLSNEVPLDNYFINDPDFIINIKEYVAPEICDQFDAASLAAYTWAVDSIDENTGFEAPVIAGEEFEYSFSWDDVLGLDLGVDQYPDSTEFLFYAKKKDSNFKKAEGVSKPFADRLMIPKHTVVPTSFVSSDKEFGQLASNNAKELNEEEGLWIQWHAGDASNAIGAGGGIMTTAARWTPADLADYDGLTITHVKVGQNDLGNNATIKIWQGSDIDNLVELYSQDFMQFEFAWITVELEEPFIIDASQELVIGVEWDYPAGTYPPLIDQTVWHGGLGDLVSLDGGPFESLGVIAPALAGDWLISAFVFGAEGPILLNKDELPISLGDEPFIGFVPEDAVTGVYEVEARAVIYGEDGEKWSCGPYAGIVKNDLLIINDGMNPDDVLAIELQGVYTPDTLLFIDTLVVGQEFNAMYSTYGGEWPEGMNFAAVLYDNSREDVLGVVDLTGEDVVMEGLRMPYIPFTDTKFNEYDLEMRIVAYEGDELIFGGTDIEFEMEENLGFVTEDIIPVADGSVYGYDFDDDEFNVEGDRWVTTPVMDLSVVDNTKAKIWFNYYNYSVSPSTQTIPVFQVSEDGGETWTDLQLLLSDVDKLYSISIEDYFSATTQFRWIQPSNLGYNEDVWSIDGVEITTGATSIFTMSNAIDIVQIIPEVDVDYAFALELEAFDLEPTIYAGDEFDFTYDLVEGGYMFPEGTVFTIYLYYDGDVVIDDFTGEEVILYQGTEVGLITATAPIVQRGTYDVYVTASYADLVPEEEFDETLDYFYDEEYVGILNIYNPVIKTNLVGLDVPYAGGTADFEGVLEIEVEEPLNPDFYYNLIIEDGGDEWLIAAQEGSATFNDVFLPPFLYGNLDFKIQASTNGPLGVVGEKIELENDQWFGGYELADETDPGQRVYYALDMNDYEIDLADFVFLSFDVYFSEAMENLTEAQHMILEYSIDGGKSYTEIHTYPDERFTDEMYFDGDYFMEEDLPIPVEAKVEGAIIRWRIQESKGDVILTNIKLSSDNTIQNAPYYALVSQIPVAQQRIEVLGTDALSYCNTEDITLTYNIRGSFGEFAGLWLGANDEWSTDLYFTGITEGTGEIVVSAQILSDMGVSGDVQFQFWVEDETYNDEYHNWFDNEFGGDISDFVYIVPEINEFTEVWADNNYSCDIAERSVIIEPQDYFVYQVRNAVTLDWLSEPVMFDPEDMSLFNMWGEFEIPIGVVSETTIAEVVVTAQSKDGSLVCETLVIDEQIVFDIHELALQYRWYNNSIGGVWTDVPADAADFIYCYESGNLEFRVWDYKADMGNGGVVDEDIKWYRDNTETPVGTDVAEFSNFPLTGEYFAVITSEGCDPWTTQLVNVVVELAPEKPVIEFVGEQEFCEGGNATLQIPDDYEYYRWYINGSVIEGANTNMIDIYQSAWYEVEVSNYPFDPFVPVCTQFSESLWVGLNIHYKPYIPDFTIVDNSLCEAMPAQIIINNWEENVWYQAYVWETGEATGEAKLGYENNIVLETEVLTDEAFLGIMAWRMGVEQCGPYYSTDIDKVMVYNLTIEVSGNTLMASIAPFNQYANIFGAISYQWFRNGVLVKNGGDGQYLTVYDEAIYSVVVTTYDGCILEASTERSEPDPDVVPETVAVNIYPNPVQNNLTLKLNGDYLGELQVKIINLAGVVLFDTNIEKNAVEFEQVISVETLTQGVYIMQITGGEYSDVKRFIKK